MQSYTITSPSLDGLLTDDNLYFEGIRKPLVAYSVRETMPDSLEHIAILERYFSDIHALFMKKFAVFSGSGTVANEETVKLQALLQEMVKVRGLIESARTAIEEKN